MPVESRKVFYYKDDQYADYTYHRYTWTIEGNDDVVRGYATPMSDLTQNLNRYQYPLAFRGRPARGERSRSSSTTIITMAIAGGRPPGRRSPAASPSPSTSPSPPACASSTTSSRTAPQACLCKRGRHLTARTLPMSGARSSSIPTTAATARPRSGRGQLHRPRCGL